MPSCYVLSLYPAWASAFFESVVDASHELWEITAIILLNVTCAIFFPSAAFEIPITYLLKVLTMSHKPFAVLYVSSIVLAFHVKSIF